MKNGKRHLVVVAGGAGFVGSHLCDALLADGSHVICIDNLQTGRTQNIRHLEREARFEMIESDIIDPVPAAIARLGKGKVDFVYNLACAASPPQYQADPEHTMMTSVLGSRNLLRLCESTGARFLLASTSEVYGDPEAHPQVETYWGNVNSTGPRACYDEGKRAAEALTFDFARSGRAEVRVARIFNTYGPRMAADDGRVVSNVVTQAVSGRDITVYGDGSQTRSFCYVDDLVEGLMALMRHDGGLPGPVNLGNPNELMVSELVELVLAMTGSASKIVSRPLPVDDPRRRRPDISRAREMLGWAPSTDLKTGLEATIAWFTDEFERANARPAARAAFALTEAARV
ncbi:dTDP-glucose 4,6-dehydratase [Alsobacter metallidurans]|uniref:dTDP-glucose 4,6-dehydratase n=1 Tax=Alsobacter metallidurans TaxID=340221 RepID=A0A917MJN2_9HYPH|nr:UDP-glucuronic acid decarboxylase family protein [Alsobacter metallidurans]GGH32585.1 dTDP-glucose 4,6-dehydratase [Alsobacter metallidurans]